jgi:hypothetical protein
MEASDQAPLDELLGHEDETLHSFSRPPPRPARSVSNHPRPPISSSTSWATPCPTHAEGDDHMKKLIPLVVLTLIGCGRATPRSAPTEPAATTQPATPTTVAEPELVQGVLIVDPVRICAATDSVVDVTLTNPTDEVRKVDVYFAITYPAAVPRSLVGIGFPDNGATGPILLPPTDTIMALGAHPLEPATAMTIKVPVPNSPGTYVMRHSGDEDPQAAFDILLTAMSSEPGSPTCP